MQHPQRKIALVGNIANNFFREALALRKAGQIDVTLYVDKSPGVHPTALPETEFPAYKDAYPHWIREFPSLDGRETELIRRGRVDLLSASTSKLIEELNTFDVVTVSAVGLFLAPALKTKTVFRPTGGDLTVLPFLSRTIVNLIQYYPRWWRLFWPRRFLSIMLQPRLWQASIESVDYIAVNKRAPFLLALKKLKVSQHRIIPGIDLAIDTATFRSVKESRLAISATISKQIGSIREEKFIVLLAGRYMARASRSARLSGDWKGSDQAIIGFRNFLEVLPENSRGSVELWILDSQMSPQISEAKKLVRKLGLDNNVRFVQGASRVALTRHELVELYSLASVCLDDFGAGWFGSVVVEALSCECPVITWVSPDFMDEYYAWHPILLAQFANEIAGRLESLFHLDADSYSKLRSSSRKWIELNFTEQNTVRRYAEIIDRVSGN